MCLINEEEYFEVSQQGRKNIDKAMYKKANFIYKQNENLFQKSKFNKNLSGKVVYFCILVFTCICEKRFNQKIFNFQLGIERNISINCNKNFLLLFFKSSRARAVVAYHQGLYHDLYKLLESHCFSTKFHNELQMLWFKARKMKHSRKSSTFEI